MITRTNQFYLDKLASREDRKGKKDGFFLSYSTQRPKVIVIWAALQPDVSQVGQAGTLWELYSRRLTFGRVLRVQSSGVQDELNAA